MSNEVQKSVSVVEVSLLILSIGLIALVAWVSPSPQGSWYTDFSGKIRSKPVKPDHPAGLLAEPLLGAGDQTPQIQP